MQAKTFEAMVSEAATLRLSKDGNCWRIVDPTAKGLAAKACVVSPSNAQGMFCFFDINATTRSGKTVDLIDEVLWRTERWSRYSPSWPTPLDPRKT